MTTFSSSEFWMRFVGISYVRPVLFIADIILTKIIDFDLFWIRIMQFSVQNTVVNMG